MAAPARSTANLRAHELETVEGGAVAADQVKALEEFTRRYWDEYNRQEAERNQRIVGPAKAHASKRRKTRDFAEAIERICQENPHCTRPAAVAIYRGEHDPDWSSFDQARQDREIQNDLRRLRRAMSRS